MNLDVISQKKPRNLRLNALPSNIYFTEHFDYFIKLTNDSS